MFKLLIFLNLVHIQFTEKVDFFLVDAETNAAIAYAHVFIDDQPQLSVTNSDGIFRMNSLPLGSVLTIRHLNYGTVKVIVTEEIKNNKLISLKTSFIELDEVTFNSDFRSGILKEIETGLTSLVKNFTNENGHSLYYLEYVQGNDSFEKFADAIFHLSKNNKKGLIGTASECRAYEFVNENKALFEVFNPIKPSLMFESLDGKFYTGLINKLNEYIVDDITESGDLKIVTLLPMEVENNLYKYTYVLDGNGKIVEILNELVSGGLIQKKAPFVKVDVNSVQRRYLIKYDKDKTIGYFARAEISLTSEIKGKMQENKFVSQFNMINMDKSYKDPVKKGKSFDKSIYKNCHGSTNPFWEEVHNLSLTKKEQEMLEKLEKYY
ncbi:carboxypeptidase-like regulatory domain-containing protein [Litoribacter populi]|uniref:carboxypeptidase-like regulatory domain-containing protein n=1 Tax=Litoribacter populi TaxID=2598460 RepID=UPI00163DE0DF|nr:carboxypeptidase-like regulatory domain-containing protein [Litoribacter populi]